MPEVEVVIKPDTSLLPPPMFKLIYLDDAKTTVTFVVDSLKGHFSYDVPTAEKIADTVHTTGSAVVGVFPFSIAEQKGLEVTMDARSQGFPLQIRLEKEDD